MLTESGRVVAIEPDAVWVETVRSSTCGACAVKASCGHGLVARASAGKGLIRARVFADGKVQNLRVDDQVQIELPENAVTRGSLMVYVLPMLLGLILATLGSVSGDLLAVLGFAGGLLAGLIFARRLPDLWGGNEFFEPRVVSVNYFAVIASDSQAPDF